MFDDDNAVSPSDECVEGIQQFADVVEVQSGGWFVKDKQGRVGFLLTQIECQFTRWFSPPDRVEEVGLI